MREGKRKKDSAYFNQVASSRGKKKIPKKKKKREKGEGPTCHLFFRGRREKGGGKKTPLPCAIRFGQGFEGKKRGEGLS